MDIPESISTICCHRFAKNISKALCTAYEVRRYLSIPEPKVRIQIKQYGGVMINDTTLKYSILGNRLSLSCFCGIRRMTDSIDWVVVSKTPSSISKSSILVEVVWEVEVDFVVSANLFVVPDLLASVDSLVVVLISAWVSATSGLNLPKEDIEKNDENIERPALKTDGFDDGSTFITCTFSFFDRFGVLVLLSGRFLRFRVE